MEKKISYSVQETDLPCTVESLLKRRLGLSKAQIKSAKFRSGGICLNGYQARVTSQVPAGAVLEVLLEQEEEGSLELEASPGALDILYEDEDLILVNKAAGVAVHPGHGHYKDTLANHLMYYFGQQKKNVIIRAVGRLDKDTSGIVVFAKNKVAAARLANRGMKKEYLALIQGHLEEKCGCVELPIGKRQDKLNEMEIAETGSFARTHYQVLEEYPESSLVKLWLDTGRTHQIRVHMAALGHPLLGDPIYGKEMINEGWKSFPKPGQCEISGENILHRAALHCRKVELRHPFTGEWITVEAPLPEDMER